MPKAMKSIYEARDGAIFRDRKLATRHEAWLDLVALTELALTGACFLDEGRIDADALAAELVKHGDELRRILRANPLKGGMVLPPQPEDSDE